MSKWERRVWGVGNRNSSRKIRLLFKFLNSVRDERKNEIDGSFNEEVFMKEVGFVFFKLMFVRFFSFVLDLRNISFSSFELEFSKFNFSIKEVKFVFVVNVFVGIVYLILVEIILEFII